MLAEIRLDYVMKPRGTILFSTRVQVQAKEMIRARMEQHFSKLMPLDHKLWIEVNKQMAEYNGHTPIREAAWLELITRQCRLRVYYHRRVRICRQ